MQEVTGIVTLVQLCFKRAHDTVDHAAALDGWTCFNFVGPTNDVGVFVHLQKLARIVTLAFGQAAIPRPDGHVGNAVVVTANEAMVGQTAIEHVKLALHFHGETVNGVFNFGWGISEEMAKAAP